MLSPGLSVDIPISSPSMLASVDVEYKWIGEPDFQLIYCGEQVFAGLQGHTFSISLKCVETLLSLDGYNKVRYLIYYGLSPIT
jgi:hypothetical protein